MSRSKYIEEFDSPRHLRRRIGEYVVTYNTRRPHQALDNQRPEQVYWLAMEDAREDAA